MFTVAWFIVMYGTKPAFTYPTFSTYCFKPRPVFSSQIPVGASWVPLFLHIFSSDGFCICNKEFKKVIITTNKCTDVWINSFQSKPPNLFPEFMAKKKATIFRLLPCSSLCLNTLYHRPSVSFYIILKFFSASECFRCTCAHSYPVFLQISFHLIRSM